VEAKGLDAFVERAAATTVGRNPDDPAARLAAAAIAKQDPAGLAHFARRVAGVAPPVIDELSGIDIPALVLVGEEDEAYLRAAEVMAKKLPRAESVTIAGAGHIVNIEAAAAFDAALIDFLRRLEPPIPASSTP